MSRFTYQMLVELIDGDQELIGQLVEEGVIERDGDDIAVVDVDRVLIARTLVRDLELDWPAIELVLRLRDELAAARKRIGELENTIAARGSK